MIRAIKPIRTFVALVITAVAIPVVAQESDTSEFISHLDHLLVQDIESLANHGNVFIDRLTFAQEADIIDKAYPLNAAIWPFNEVSVCWETMGEEFATQRALVQDAIAMTWEAASGLEFFGWGECFEDTGGIHIATKDIGPHVKSLGQFVDGVPEGMVLNFTYENWSPGCHAQPDYCNRVIAVHEFGHAIGFAHEQNRPDTPGECDQAQGTQGDNTDLTPWDPDSVMNYCNPVYGNGGVLSAFDVAAVQYIYGKR